MKVRRLFVISGMVLIGLTLVATALYVRRPSVMQPIDFSHKAHMNVPEKNIECDTCHRYYMERTVAGHPSLDICTNCHATAETPEQEKILWFEERGEEIPWKRIYRMPDFVYFSHARHVVAGKIECFTCHGRVANINYPLVKPLIQIDMSYCISCHNDNQITTDCNACHK